MGGLGCTVSVAVLQEWRATSYVSPDVSLHSLGLVPLGSYFVCAGKRARGELVVLLLSCPQHTGPSYLGKTRAGSISASLTPPLRLGLEASYSVRCLSPIPLVSCTHRQVCKILPRNWWPPLSLPT